VEKVIQQLLCEALSLRRRHWRNTRSMSSSLPGMRAFLQRYGAWIGSGSPIAKVSVLPNSFVEWNVSRCYRT